MNKTVHSKIILTQHLIQLNPPKQTCNDYYKIRYTLLSPWGYFAWANSATHILVKEIMFYIVETI